MRGRAAAGGRRSASFAEAFPSVHLLACVGSPAVYRAAARGATRSRAPRRARGPRARRGPCRVLCAPPRGPRWHSRRAPPAGSAAAAARASCLAHRRLEPLPHASQSVPRLLERARSRRFHAVVTARPAAALCERLAEPRLEVALALEPLQRRVDGA